MKHWTVLLTAFAVILAACGQDRVVEVGSDQLPLASTVGLGQPDYRDASPEPIAEPASSPVPEPGPAPAPKPVRPVAPTPPPARERPVPGSRIPRVPPGMEALPVITLSEANQQVQSAVLDLAERLELAVLDIEILDARSVTWRDGSMGCPQPGIGYGQVTVPGSLVVLRAGESSYRYHASGELTPFLCTTPESPLEGSA